MKIRFVIVAMILFCIDSYAQTTDPIPSVQVSQGQLVGSLPYGRHFYLVGDANIINDEPVSRITAEIWNTGRIQYRRSKRLTVPLHQTEAEIARIKQNATLTATASWQAKLAEDPASFQLYIGTPLQVRTQYFVVLHYYQDVVLSLDEAEKEALMVNYLEQTERAYIADGGGISATRLNEMLEKVAREVLEVKIQSAGWDHLPESDFSFSSPVISEATFAQLRRKLGRITSSRGFISATKKDLNETVEPLLNSLDRNTQDYRNTLAQKRDMEAQIEQRLASIEVLQAEAVDLLQVIRRQEILVKTSVTVTDTEVSVPQLDAINLGTAFGSSVVGMNLNNSGSADYDVLSYSALKFYLSPVDKRIHDPYVDNFLLGRLSFLLGVSFNQKLDYKGSTLKDAIGFFPVMGLSYDVNRYFALDVGATLFEQQPVSTFSSDKELRVGPLLGLTFDLDLMNRFRTTFKGDSYLINPN